MEEKQGRLVRHAEELLGRSCWVIDALPMQVPAGAGGQFFVIERTYFEGSHRNDLRHAFLDVLVKLNCYRDLVIIRLGAGKSKKNPRPDKLAKWVVRGTEELQALLPEDDALLVLPTDGTCMALYGPTPELLDLVKQLAQSAGLFVWQPAQEA